MFSGIHELRCSCFPQLPYRYCDFPILLLLRRRLETMSRSTTLLGCTPRPSSSSEPSFLGGEGSIVRAASSPAPTGSCRLLPPSEQRFLQPARLCVRKAPQGLLVAGPGDVHPARRAHLLGEGSVPASLAPHCPCRPRRALRHRPGERSLPRPRSRVPVRPPQRPQAGHRPGCSRPEGLVASFSFKGAMAATLLGPERLGVGGRG